VLRGISAFQGRSSVKTWLFRILVNRARTAGVRERRTVTLGEEPAVDPARFGRAGQWASPPQHWAEDADDRMQAAKVGRPHPVRYRGSPAPAAAGGDPARSRRAGQRRRMQHPADQRRQPAGPTAPRTQSSAPAHRDRVREDLTMRLDLRMRSRDLACQQAVELVTDYLEDALSHAAHRRFETHPAGCPHRTEYLAQMRATIKLTGQLTPADLSPRMQEEFIALYRRWKDEPRSE
jgi:Putative zinc-finger